MSDRAQGGPDMKFGSPYGGLFCNLGADPREYFGPPNPKRCVSANSDQSGGGNYTPGSRRGVSNNSSIQRGRSSGTSSDGGGGGGGGSGGPYVRRGLLIRSDSPDADSSSGGGGGYYYGRGNKTLENIDLNIDISILKDTDILLDSPTSVEACLRLGLSPFDFYVPKLDEVVKKMKDEGEDISDQEVIRLRYKYLQERAAQKWKNARRERIQIGEERRHRSRDHSSSSHGGADADSTRIQDEEKRLQKIIENNKNRLRQQLLHSQLVEKQREREEQKMEAQRRADEAQKRFRVREMIERSKKEEEAQALRHEARELERQEQQRRVELKRAMYEAKDRQVKERIEKQRMEAEAENEAKRLLNLERQKQMKEQAETVALTRREQFKRRNEAFEAAQAEYREQLTYKREERAAIARLKQQKIANAIQRSNEQQAARIHRALEKERLAEMARHQQQLQEEEQQRLKHEMDEEKELERQAVIREAQLRQQQKVHRIQEKIQATEEHMEEMAEIREREARRRMELQYHKELDKLDCVQRSKLIEEHRIAQLEAANQEKIRRVEKLQTQQATLKEKRKLHRQEAERTRIVMQEVTPGPSDFVVSEGNVGSNGPKWKMGLPASTMASRVVVRNVPAAGYDGSPGPCVYQFERVLDARHRKPEAFSMIKHDRWKAQSEASMTPGPADYAPTSPPFQIKSRPSSSCL